LDRNLAIFVKFRGRIEIWSTLNLQLSFCRVAYFSYAPGAAAIVQVLLVMCIDSTGPRWFQGIFRVPTGQGKLGNVREKYYF